MVYTIRNHKKFSRPGRLLPALLFLFVTPWLYAQPPPGFVNVGEYIIDLEIEVRYFGSNNFVGTPIDGYRAEKIYLTREAADALLRVQADLRQIGLGLKIFDGYRPQRAVDHFVRWAQDLSDNRMKQRFYPNVDKANLFRDGYIAERSGHSRGSTVDLTLVSQDTGRELNMGTRWDFFDPASWPSSEVVGRQPRANRMLLQIMMMKHGFLPLREEWWHFTLENEPYPETFFDFAIE